MNFKQLASGGGYNFDKHEFFGRYAIRKDLFLPLARTSRYDGHTTAPWPVAIHSVAVARCIELVTNNKEMAAGGLGHDFHESITGDITTPVAVAVGYDVVRSLQHKVQASLEEKLGIPNRLSMFTWRDQVRLGDLAALFVEKQLFCAPEPAPWNVSQPPPIWMQTMHDVMLDIINEGEHHDGGASSLEAEYKRLIIGAGE